MMTLVSKSYHGIMRSRVIIGLVFLLLLSIAPASRGQDGISHPLKPYLIQPQYNISEQHAGDFQLHPLELEWHVAGSATHRIPLWSFQVEGARVVGLYFSRLFIPGGDSLLIKDAGNHERRWFFTAREAGLAGPHAMPMLDGQAFVLEYFRHPSTRLQPAIVLESVAYGGDAAKSWIEGTHAPESQTPCKINVNCMPEGMAWQDHKKSVVRILLKKGSLLQITSGVLINNTNQDATPYVLTSDMVTTGVSPADLLQTVFYFGHELAGCDTTGVSPFIRTLTGAAEVASGGISCNLGSDFFLIKLSRYIPASYQPYFAGWDRSGAVADSGVSIHFSGGMFKQISTFDTLLQHGQFGGGIQGTHWKLKWASTANGFSTTGSGGEGAPLFNKNGRLIGTYTGGTSNCQNPGSYDYFGKFSVSWDQLGATPSTRLREWLDPLGTGVMTLEGAYPTVFPPEAGLSYSDSAIMVGDTIVFWDQSASNPANWEWQFPGGQPASWTGSSPPAVQYNLPGIYGVFLRVSNAYGSDSLILQNRIFVYPQSDTILTRLDTISACADTIYVPVLVSNYYFVKSGTLTLAVDTNKLTFLGLDYLNPGLQGANPQAYVADGNLWVTYQTPTVRHLGTDTLVVLKFLADTGDIPLEWNTFRPWMCKYYRVSGQDFPVRFKGGHLQALSCARVNGYLRYHEMNYGLPSSSVHFIPSTGPTLSCHTGNQGEFLRGGLLPGQYLVQAATSLSWGGVNATDALMILRHFVGMDTLTGLRLAAADVDGGGFVNASDAMMAARRFAGLIDSFPASDWIWSDSLIQVTDGQYIISLEGICRGDVNASRTAGMVQSAILPGDGSSQVEKSTLPWRRGD